MTQSDVESDFAFPDIPITALPEELIEILVSEIRKPLISIEGIANVLSEDEFTGQHQELLKSIPRMTMRVRTLLDKVEVYVEKRKKLKKEESNNEI